jgi:hypothetical protein
VNEFKHVIDGHRVTSKTFKNCSPLDNRLIGLVCARPSAAIGVGISDAI